MNTRQLTCPKCRTPWVDRTFRQRRLLALVAAIFLGLTIGIRRTSWSESDDNGGPLFELALSGQIPFWSANLALAVGGIGLLGLVYFEFVSSERDYHCENCGHELHIPRRSWSKLERGFAWFVVCGILSVLVALAGLVVIK